GAAAPAVASSEPRNCFFDVTLGDAGEIGNMRRSLGLHGAVRVGWRLSGFPSAAIQSGADRATPHPLEIGLVVGFEARRVFYTALVSATPGSNTFSAAKAVYDKRYGFYVRYDAFRVSYQLLRRSSEFSIAGVKQKTQDFASISASYERKLEDSPD